MENIIAHSLEKLYTEYEQADQLFLDSGMKDKDVYTARMEELLQNIEEKLKQIPYIDKLVGIKGLGLVTVSRFIAEVGDIDRFDNPKQLQKLAGLAIVADSFEKHNGESRISYRGEKPGTDWTGIWDDWQKYRPVQCGYTVKRGYFCL